jgi:hypothetical protein
MVKWRSSCTPSNDRCPTMEKRFLFHICFLSDCIYWRSNGSIISKARLASCWACRRILQWQWLSEKYQVRESVSIAWRSLSPCVMSWIFIDPWKVHGEIEPSNPKEVVICWMMSIECRLFRVHEEMHKGYVLEFVIRVLIYEVYHIVWMLSNLKFDTSQLWCRCWCLGILTKGATCHDLVEFSMITAIKSL